MRRLVAGMPSSSRSARARFVHTALLVVSALSLLLLLAVRLYAAWELPAVHTQWDDGYYRAAADEAVRNQEPIETALNLVMPHGGLVIDGRLNGYNDWLAVGLRVRRMLGLGNREISFQTVNTVMLLLQAVVVLLFAWWALRDRALACAVAFLFIGAPVVFGTSRWVHTENLVLLLGPALSALTAWLLEPRLRIGRHAWLSGLWRVAAAAWVIGLCSRGREYAAPSFLGLVGITEFILLIRRRWLDAGILALVLGAFAVPFAPALVEALKVTLSKGGQSNYFHSVQEWIPHVSFYTVGPAMTILLTVLGVVVVLQRFRILASLVARFASTPGRILRAELSGVRPLLWGHLFLLLVYIAFFLWSRNRVTRPAVPMMLAALGLVLIGVRTLPALRAWLSKTPAKVMALGLFGVAWAVLTYQLWFAFEGGKTYAHHGARLEYFNYPLRLRELKDESDTYICIDVCIYDKQ
jgi:hypothetical protein